MNNKAYKRLVILNLVLVFLVIAAGAFVRMTGSGMGCPDWPKCFGYWIPPTEKAQLEWKPREFEGLKKLYDQLIHQNIHLEILSMGMSGDYPIAIQKGSNMIRLGSKIFGPRNY